MPESVTQRAPGLSGQVRFVVLTREARLALRGDANALTVYLALLDRVAGTEGTVYPSYARIAEDAGVSKRSVSTAIAALEALGLISREKRTNEAGQASNLYIVRAFPKVQDLHPGEGTICSHPRANFAHEEEPVEEEPTTPAAAPAATAADEVLTRAWVIQKRVHERRTPAPLNAKQTMTIAHRWINEGFDERVVEDVMVAAPVCSQASVEFLMSKQRPAQAVKAQTRVVNGVECRFMPGSGWVPMAGAR